MPALSTDQLECYLKSIAGPSARIVRAKVLGESEKEGRKGYGYGSPVLIDYETDGRQQRAVLHTISPGPFGHEHMADRAQILFWEHKSFNDLPRHIRSIDIGAFRRDGSVISIGDADEFFILTEYAEGRGYFQDLTRMRDDSRLSALDTERADALCVYFVYVPRVDRCSHGL